MHSIFVVLLVLACATAQDFSHVKHMRIEIDTSNDPLVKQKPVEKDPNAGNDTESKIHPTGRIIDGAPAMRGQFPWQVVYYMDGSHMCGGSIISPQYILTAAHCTLGFQTFVITMGSTDRINSQYGQLTVTTSTKIVNSNYNLNNYNNDIAVLKVPIIQFSSSGYISNNLQYAGVRVISNYECQQVYGTSYVAPTNICTRNKYDNKGTCSGDSGGPLVYLEGNRYTEIGIVSFGVKGCKGAPSAYTRVTSYLGWISRNTNIVMRL